MRITAGKNLALLRHEAELAVNLKAAGVRARFATRDKHQIYADKRDEANRFLVLVEMGMDPNDQDFPYLAAETGISAPTMIDLAHLWIFMDQSWKSIAASIEQISLSGKIRIRAAAGPAEIDQIVSQTSAILDAIGSGPPVRPKPQF